MRWNFVLIGSVLAIIISRLYVAFHAPLNIYLFGYLLHHFYYGLALILLSWFFLVITDSLHWDILDRTLSFMFGVGFGLAADEITFFLHPYNYTLADYYNPLNYLVDFILIGFLIFIIYEPKVEERTGETDI